MRLYLQLEFTLTLNKLFTEIFQLTQNKAVSILIHKVSMFIRKAGMLLVTFGVVFIGNMLEFLTLFCWVCLKF